MRDFLIKVCGITTAEDARLAAEHGANALGFNFYPRSPRYLQLERAAEIIQLLPSDILTVGIFVGQPEGSAADLVEVLQLHGLHDPKELPPGRRVLVATSPEAADLFPDHEIIIDTSWGTGRQADWKALKRLKRPYILSGGLTPENLGEALQTLHPAGVDVCSGVERSPGVKDPEKLRCFLQEATAWRK